MRMTVIVVMVMILAMGLGMGLRMCMGFGSGMRLARSMGSMTVAAVAALCGVIAWVIVVVSAHGLLGGLVPRICRQP